MFEAGQFSVADFYVGDSDNPLNRPEDFTQWRAATTVVTGDMVDIRSGTSWTPG